MNSNFQEIKKAQNELYLMKREIEDYNNPKKYKIKLEDLFHFHGNEAMLQAKFYHECRMKLIPCILQVQSEYGRLDAVIEINHNYYVIELKYLHGNANLNCINQCKEQLTRYLKNDYPVILINKSDDIRKILTLIQETKLDNCIYTLDDENKKLTTVSYQQ